MIWGYAELDVLVLLIFWFSGSFVGGILDRCHIYVAAKSLVEKHWRGFEKELKKYMD